jgi:hypothetical protein
MLCFERLREWWGKKEERMKDTVVKAGEAYVAALKGWVKVGEEVKGFVLGTTVLTTKTREEYRRLKEKEVKALGRFMKARERYFALFEEWSEKHLK